MSLWRDPSRGMLGVSSISHLKIAQLSCTFIWAYNYWWCITTIKWTALLRKKKWSTTKKICLGIYQCPSWGRTFKVDYSLFQMRKSSNLEMNNLRLRYRNIVMRLFRSFKAKRLFCQLFSNLKKNEKKAKFDEISRFKGKMLQWIG